MQRLTVVSSIAPSAAAAAAVAAAAAAVISAHSRQASRLMPRKLSSYPRHIVASSQPVEIQCIT